jgi:hypothetical protein
VGEEETWVPVAELMRMGAGVGAGNSVSACIGVSGLSVFNAL